MNLFPVALWVNAKDKSCCCICNSRAQRNWLRMLLGDFPARRGRTNRPELGRGFFEFDSHLRQAGVSPAYIRDSGVSLVPICGVCEFHSLPRDNFRLEHQKCSVSVHCHRECCLTEWPMIRGFAGQDNGYVQNHALASSLCGIRWGHLKFPQIVSLLLSANFLPKSLTIGT